jgi:DtxR family Mn-dependent transcriptional regulator
MAAPVQAPPCHDLFASPEVEDALRAVSVLAGQGAAVSASSLAGHLGVDAREAAGLIERLEVHGLVQRTPGDGGGGLALTRHGGAHARHLLRRYRLVELFLVQVLHLSRDEAPDEADLLEHAVSARLLERIDALLGRPERDLRGDPVPRFASGVPVPEPPEPALA